MSRNQTQKRRSGIANVTGWIASSGARHAPTDTRDRRAPAARPTAPSRGAAARARRPAAHRARRPRSARAASASGDGQTTQSGASSTRNGSTCAAEPDDLLARRPVVSSRAGAREPCSRPPAPCSPGRIGRPGIDVRRRARSRTAQPSRRASRPRRRAPTRVLPKQTPTRGRLRVPGRSSSRLSHSCRVSHEARGPRRSERDAATRRLANARGAIVDAATASVHAVSNGVGCPLPG